MNISETELTATKTLLESAKEMRRCSERLIRACESKIEEAKKGEDGFVIYYDNKIANNLEEMKYFNRDLLSVEAMYKPLCLTLNRNVFLNYIRENVERRFS